MILARTIAIAGGLLFLRVLPARAGDAVAIAYNSEGVWTTVTYYSSSTAKGGKDYKDESQAREAVAQDLRRREGANLARVEILASSDSTGFVAVARGETAAGKDLTVVGRGKSPAEAETKALADLDRQGATARQKVVYRYFSQGTDFASKP